VGRARRPQWCYTEHEPGDAIVRQSTLLPRLVRFAGYELDIRSGELRRDGLTTKLQDQPLQILLMLLEHPGELVTREALHNALWPGSSFGDVEDSLNHAVRRLRAALGDLAEHPKFIETLARRGYRFIAPVEIAAAHGGASAVVPVYGRRTEDAAHSAALHRRISLAVGTIVVTLAALTVLNVGGLRERVFRAVGAVREPPLQIQSIAILPFDNLSHDPEQEYFADGLTEQLITDLGQISALRVISRTSVMQYKGTKTPLPQIARELNVDGLVEGAILRSGGRVRITAQLIQANPERHLWARTYERDLRDVLAIQGEVAQAVAREVRVKVTPLEQTRLVRARAVNPEAYEACLKGRYFNHRQTREDTLKANDYFVRAIEADPSYAPAYAGLADNYTWATFGFLGVRPKEAFAKAEQAATRALELDDTLAEAHSSLAYVRYVTKRDWETGEKGFQRALEMNPNLVTAHESYALCLMTMGRFEESIAEFERALDLDPLSVVLNVELGSPYYFAGKHAQAMKQFRKALELDQNFPLAHFNLGLSFTQLRRYDDAIKEFQTALAGERENAIFLAPLGYCYAVAGKRAEALQVLASLRHRGEKEYISEFLLAMLYTGLHENEQAITALEKAYQEQDGWLIIAKVEPDLDPLRSDPRFQDLLRRMNFPQ